MDSYIYSDPNQGDLMPTIIQQLTTDELNVMYLELSKEYTLMGEYDNCTQIIWVMDQIYQELLSRPTELATRVYGA